MGQLVELVRLQVKFILWKRIHNKKQELHAPPGKYCEGDTVEAQECDSECPPGLNKSIKQGFTLLPVFIEKDGAMFVPFVVLMSDCFSFQQ